MSTSLATPGRVAIASIPALGFFATPFLPFAQEPALWLGLPPVLVWTASLVVLTVVCLQIVDVLYLRAGGRERDDSERRCEASALPDSFDVTIDAKGRNR